jgi:hypothetical protein
MKLVGVMTLESNRNKIRKLFEQHELKIYSEVEITGHTQDTVKSYGWWVFERSDIPIYSNLFFVILPEQKAHEILGLFRNWDNGDREHPPRVFMVNVEEMI